MNTLNPKSARALIQTAQSKKLQFAKTPHSEIIDVIDRVAKLWGRNGPFYSRAVQDLEKSVTFSKPMLEYSLDILPELCSKKNLVARLKAEFQNLEILDRFTERENFEGRVRFVPHGVLLHVSAGNVFLGAIDSLVLGLLTKNINIVKLSHSNQIFPKLFFESIRMADPTHILQSAVHFAHFKGGDTEVEKVFHEGVDAVIAWGGEEMIRSYRKGLPPGIPLIEHGPKISIQVLFNRALQENSIQLTAKKIAHDILMWDQAACSSPQNCFIQNEVNEKELLDAVAIELENPEFARGKIDGDEAVEIHKEYYRGLVTQSTEGGYFKKGNSWLLHFDPRPGVRPSPLNRTLIFKKFKDLEDLRWQLGPARGSLQSCSYLANGRDRTRLLEELSLIGMQRFATLGTIMEGMTGAPHDGHYALSELGRFVPDETRTDVLEFVNDCIRDVSTYNKLYQNTEIHDLSQLKALDKLDIQIPDHLQIGGQIFSSGGTSGTPKYVFFSNDEFQKTAKLLARGYLAQGLQPGDRCANLFVAGNLWSSFLAVEKALIHCQSVQLPIGGLADPELTLQYLEKFKPRAIFGLPSLLTQLAAKSIGRKINIEMVFYAGEHLTLSARQVLSEAWGTQHIHSAGYASVDAGPIGYACPFTLPREHHLFEDAVHLEIQNEEGLVTSLIRRTLPVIHLRTGDHIEWTSKSGEKCACGSGERRFLLHGRVDGQIRVFSSRILLEEVEKAIASTRLPVAVFQIQINDELMPQNSFHETLKLIIELSDRIDKDQIETLHLAIYQHCKDLKATISYSQIKEALKIVAVGTGEITRVARTGKVRMIVDQRKV